jgi:opacity protein-like surface antigen
MEYKATVQRPTELYLTNHKTTHMKNFTISILCLLLSSSSILSQDHKYEVGLRLTSFDSYGSIVKVRNKNGNYQRFRVATANLRFSVRQEETNLGTSGQISYGIEKRRKINNDLIFYHGFEPFIGLSITAHENTSGSAFLGLGYVTGLQYAINNKFSASLEIIPSLRQSLGMNGGQGAVTEAAFNINNIAISFVHCFSPYK